MTCELGRADMKNGQRKNPESVLSYREANMITTKKSMGIVTSLTILKTEHPREKRETPQ